MVKCDFADALQNRGGGTKMKRKILVAAMVVLAVGLVGTVAFAARGGFGPGTQVDLDKFKHFQQETGSLRDDMMLKGMELRNEFAKEQPDKNQITKLRNEMADLRTKIQAIAEKDGLPAWGRGAGKGFGGGCGGRGMMRGRGWGRGAGETGNPGCGGDCPKQ
jgi:hypothetical protein